MKNRMNVLLGTAVLSACTMIGTSLPIASAQAQASALQYVVVYGEFRPDPYSILQGERQLEFLTDLARKAPGSISFATYTEIGRGNFFSFIEVWKDSASYTAFQNATNTQKALADLTPYEIAPLDERDGNLVE
jgi:quinol monooxygenase YgiN